MSVNNSKTTSQTDQAALEIMSDEEIDYSDIPSLTEEFFDNATLRIPPSQAHEWIKLDSDVIQWLQIQKEDSQALLNRIIRQHIESKRSISA